MENDVQNEKPQGTDLYWFTFKYWRNIKGASDAHFGKLNIWPDFWYMSVLLVFAQNVLTFFYLSKRFKGIFSKKKKKNNIIIDIQLFLHNTITLKEPYKIPYNSLITLNFFLNTPGVMQR